MTDSTMPQVLTQDIGDTGLQYLLYECDGPTLVLMHATGFQPWLWHPIARALAGKWRIVAPYFCDHRVSDPDEGGLHWMQVAEDLKIFCERLGIRTPGLVGHSMGATVLTLAHAAFGLEATGMVLVEPIFLPQDFYRVHVTVDMHPLAAKSIKRRDHWTGREEALSYLRSRPLFGKWDDEMLSLYLDHGFRPGDAGGLSLACSPKREASLFMGAVHYDPWPLLPKVSCPALLLEGEESENRPYIDLRKAASLMPGGEYRLVEGAGHLIPMEQPGLVARTIGEFFAGR